MGPARTPVWRKLLFSAALLAVLLAAAEVVARIALVRRPPPPAPSLVEQKHCAYDERLGWRNLPSVRRADIYGPGRSLTNNARGFRALEEYAPDVPAGRTRVVCLGDSFTMGFGVDDRETYPAWMERHCPAVQAVNMGLGAYGLGQDWLWYRSDGTELRTDVLLFAFIDADVNRLGMDVFGGFPKPRVDLEDGALVVRNQPVPRAFTTEGETSVPGPPWLQGLALARLLGERLRAPTPAYAPPTPERREHTLRVAEAIFTSLAELSASRGQAFVLAYLPTGRLAGKDPSPTAGWVAGWAAASGTPLIDLGPDFLLLPPGEREAMFLPDTHFSEAGNAFVARRLLDGLARCVPGFPACQG